QKVSLAPAWSYSWDRLDEPRPLTGNTSGANAAIGGFAAFNLVASLSIGPAFLQRIHLQADPTAGFFFSWFPPLFSLIFFSIPAARWLREKRRVKARLRRQYRNELLREIHTYSSESFDPEALSRRVAQRLKTSGALANEGEARQALERLLGE